MTSPKDQLARNKGLIDRITSSEHWSIQGAFTWTSLPIMFALNERGGGRRPVAQAALNLVLISILLPALLAIDLFVWIPFFWIPTLLSGK